MPRRVDAYGREVDELGRLIVRQAVSNPTPNMWRSIAEPPNVVPSFHTIEVSMPPALAGLSALRSAVEDALNAHSAAHTFRDQRLRTIGEVQTALDDLPSLSELASTIPEVERHPAMEALSEFDDAVATIVTRMSALSTADSEEAESLAMAYNRVSDALRSLQRGDGMPAADRVQQVVLAMRRGQRQDMVNLRSSITALAQRCTEFAAAMANIATDYDRSLPAETSARIEALIVGTCDSSGNALSHFTSGVRNASHHAQRMLMEARHHAALATALDTPATTANQEEAMASLDLTRRHF